VTVLAAGAAPETLRATPNHPFFVTGLGWIRADELRQRDRLVAEGREALSVACVRVVAAQAETFNFEVEDDHTYFVAADAKAPAVWVHNECRVLAEVDYWDPIDEKVASSKPSSQARLRPKKHLYENPGQHDLSNNPANANRYDPTKSVLPKNHIDLFKKSVPVTLEDGSIVRWTKVGTGKNAVYHRFDGANNRYHWNGSTNGITASGEPRAIKLTAVPKEVLELGE
jgi:hypothetical protein